jgi:hypothetical protein
MSKITFPNGIYFVQHEKDIINSLFTGSTTASGTYKVKDKGILFYDIKGEPFVYLSANNEYSPFFVTCWKENGRIHYLLSGCISKTEELLGINKMGHIEGREFALEIWRENKKN